MEVYHILPEATTEKWRWGTAKKMFTLAALTLGNYYCIIN